MPTVLTIAGFDPSSGAGVTADLAVFAAHGLFGTSCITGLTVQSTMGVISVHPVSGGVVRATLDCLQADLPPVGIKIGMLGTEECVAAVAEYLDGLEKLGARPVVVLDPVLRSSSGRELLEPAGVDLLRERLLPMVDWVTPNVEELGVLAGILIGPERAREKIEEVALGVQRRLCPGASLLVTGGDLNPPDDLYLPVGGQGMWVEGTLIETSSTHGTGCALSSALLSRLVLGDTSVAAVRGAKDYVTEALRRAEPMGKGHGPMNHLWIIRRNHGS